jgi:hypothetical protein
MSIKDIFTDDSGATDAMNVLVVFATIAILANRRL